MNFSRKLAVTALALLSLSRAWAGDDDLVVRAETKEGCVFYTYPIYQVASASWDGKCTPGAELAGRGTLRYLARYMDPKDGFIGNRETVESGEFKGGRLDGPGSRQRTFFDKDGRKTKEMTWTGSFAAGLQSGQGERLFLIYRPEDGTLKQRAEDKGTYREDNLYPQGRRVITSPLYERFEKKIIDAEFYPSGDIRRARVTFTKTALGGDIVLEDVMFEADKSLDNINGYSGGGLDNPEIPGILKRPGSPLAISLRIADLNSATGFLNNFTLKRRNWSAECKRATEFTKRLVRCDNGWVTVNNPPFNYDANLSINRSRGFGFRLVDLDREDNPVPELLALLEIEQFKQKEADEQAVKNSVFSHDEFTGCVRLSQRIDQEAAEMAEEERRIEDRKSNVGMLKTMIESAQSNGFRLGSDSYDSYRESVRQLQGMADAYNRRVDKNDARIDDYNGRCLRKGSVPTAWVDESCRGVETHFCERYR